MQQALSSQYWLQTQWETQCLALSLICNYEPSWRAELWSHFVTLLTARSHLARRTGTAASPWVTLTFTTCTKQGAVFPVSIFWASWRKHRLLLNTLGMPVFVSKEGRIYRRELASSLFHLTHFKTTMKTNPFQRHDCLFLWNLSFKVVNIAYTFTWNT